jgi:hypothetical protein
MKGWRRAVALLGAFAAATTPVAAQDDPRNELWPEVDVWVRVDPKTQLFFPLAVTRAREVDYREGLVGAHVDYRFDRTWSARVGYRYLWALGDVVEEEPYREHRPVMEGTGRIRLPHGILLLDRNRVDLRFVNEAFSWRYRNRLRAERNFVLSRDRAILPYAMLEAGWDSRYDTFNRARLNLGGEYQFSPRVWLDAYLARQWDSEADVRDLLAFGLALNVAWTLARARAP